MYGNASQPPQPYRNYPQQQQTGVPVANYPQQQQTGVPVANYPQQQPQQRQPAQTRYISCGGDVYIGVQARTKGRGPQAQAGHTVVVHYTGVLENGQKFDSSRDRGEPFSFQLGAGKVIKGWDVGVATMRVGDRTIFSIPSVLGYGQRGSPPSIPPNATLLFDVELLQIHGGPNTQGGHTNYQQAHQAQQHQQAQSGVPQPMGASNNMQMGWL